MKNLNGNFPDLYSAGCPGIVKDVSTMLMISLK